MTSQRPSIVVIGGGTGTSVVLDGLKHRDVDLTAVVTAFDSGGSSGRLRAEFGHLSQGDLRRCLIALAEDSPETEAFRVASGYRFNGDSSLQGHNLGNLFLSALTLQHSDIEIAVLMMSRMLRITGQVFPVALEPRDLCAELVDGSVLRGEATIDLRRKDPPKIKRVYLDQPVMANPRVLDAITDADVIILGPGDLYTSIIPNLLADGVAEAIRNSRGHVAYVSNLMTKHGETDGFHVEDFAREVSSYLGDIQIDTLLMNTAPVPVEVQDAYATVNAEPVTLNSQHSTGCAARTVGMPLIRVFRSEDTDELRVRHDPVLLAHAVMGIVGLTREKQSDTLTGQVNANAAD